MTKFKVGDRVAFYDGIARNTGTVDEIDSTVDAIRVDDVWLHAKQCRRLKKKERRRVWLNPEFVPSAYQPKTRAVGTKLVISVTPVPEFIEFVEVKRK